MTDENREDAASKTSSNCSFICSTSDVVFFLFKNLQFVRHWEEWKWNFSIRTSHDDDSRRHSTTIISLDLDFRSCCWSTTKNSLDRHSNSCLDFHSNFRLDLRFESRSTTTTNIFIFIFIFISRLESEAVHVRIERTSYNWWWWWWWEWIWF